MENIKPLGNKVEPLEVGASLGESSRLTLRKESNFLCGNNHLLQPLANQLPLVKASKFFLPRHHESYLNSLINWDDRKESNDFSTDTQAFDLSSKANVKSMST